MGAKRGLIPLADAMLALAVLALASGSVTAQPAPTQLPVRALNGAAINASVAPVGGTALNPVLAITQTASPNNRAVIEWSGFSIGRDAKVNIAQPNAQSLLLNRVFADAASGIYGGLSANGRVFIVNPFGIVFGGSAQVNVGSLVASTLVPTDKMTANGYDGFLNAKAIELSATRPADVTVGSPENPALNKIQIGAGGTAMLVSTGQVFHAGAIEAPGGRIHLAAATEIQLVPVGASGFIDLAILRPATTGGVNVTGVLDASTALAGARGGQVILQGPALAVGCGECPSTLSANGPAGGGAITIGDANARAVLINPDGRLSADATELGDGGSITLRATFNQAPVSAGPQPRVDFGVAEMYGALSTRGGPQGGNGGRIETSGMALNTSLAFPGSPFVQAGTVDASARTATGRAGSWSLDPFDVTVSSAATLAVNGQFNPTGPGANVRAADLSAALDGGTAIEIVTGTSGIGAAAGNIALASDAAIVRTTGPAPTSLTLRAHGNVTLDAGSRITAAAGAPLDINLYSDLDGNGSGGVALTGATIASGGGNVTLSGGVDPATGFAAAGVQVPGVGVQRSGIDTSGAAGRGDLLIRGAGAAATVGSVAPPAVSITDSTLLAHFIGIRGQAGAGTAVASGNTFMSTDSGLIEMRGVATRNIAGQGQAIGVDFAGATFVDLGAGSLLVAGRGDDNGLAAASPAIGVRINALSAGGGGGPAGRVTLAGQSAGSAAPGIALAGAGVPGLSVVNNTEGGVSPVDASVVIGASAGPSATLASTMLELGSGAAPTLLTNGAVNLRPLGVDAGGSITEQSAIPILIGTPSAASAGSFVIAPAWLQRPGAQAGGIAAGQGIVVGSSVHTGLITLADGALTAHADLALNLQNQGAGSAGIRLGAGNALRDLGLLSAGNVSQTGPIAVQSLLIQGGAASTVDLSQSGNQIGRLAFDPPRSLSVTAQGNLTIDAASALGCDAATGAFTPLALTNSQGGTQAVLRAIGGNLLLNRSITMAGPGATRLDLVSDRRFVAAPGATISSPAGGQWRVWAGTAADVDRAGLQGTNLYGCAFGDAAACSLSGIAVPANGNHFLFVERPLLVVSADARSSVAGAPIPPLTYAVSGLANGDSAADALAGALATPATARPGVYAITRGALNSPLGYQLQFLGADLTLERPSLTLPDNQKAPLHSRFLPEQRSDIYGNNLSLPIICTAASMIRNDAGDGPSNDPLATEWGRVRNQPQLSGCLDVTDGGRCDAF